MKLSTLLSTAAALLCGATLSLFAQAPGGGPPGGGGVLTPEQRTKLREVMQGAQAELGPLTEKLAAAQKEAIKAVLSGDASEQTIRTKAEAVARLQTEIAVLRAKALKGMAASFTAEQKTQMESRPGPSYNLLFGGAGGRGGGGAARPGAGGGRPGGGGQGRTRAGGVNQ